MKFILGKKLDMTQVWQEGKVQAVTRIQAGPCIVAQVKTSEKDGYQAIQVGFGKRNEKNIKKPQRGHLKKCKMPRLARDRQNAKCKINLRYLREFRISESEKDLKPGDVINVNTFKVGDTVKATGISKGKGFQGVVKRHGFHGAPKSHGTKDQLRMPGSIGATGPAHVFKGKKMPGQMGGDKVTVANLEIVEVDKDNNILLIKGAVPGARNGLLLISGEGELKLKVESEKLKAEDRKQNTEETKNSKDIELKKQSKDLSYKELLENNKNKEESKMIDKYKILQDGGLAKDGKDHCWYDRGLLIFTEEDITNYTLDSIKESLNMYIKNKK